MTVCRLLECKHNERHNDPLCGYDRPVEIGKNGMCSYFEPDYAYRREQGRQRDKRRPWLERNPGRIQSRDNGILIGEIQKLLMDAVDTEFGGLLASEIRQGLLDKGIIVTPQKIGNLITHRGENIKTVTNQVTPSKWVNMYSMEAEK